MGPQYTLLTWMQTHAGSDGSRCSHLLQVPLLAVQQHCVAIQDVLRPLGKEESQRISSSWNKGAMQAARCSAAVRHAGEERGS